MVWFEWDEAKAKSNEQSMACASMMRCLFSPILMPLVEQDRVEGGELRWQTVGLVGGVVMLLVAHTIRDEGSDEIIRIISARRATKKESKRYDENRAERSF